MEGEAPLAGVVLAAAGAGRRFGARKQFLTLAGRPLLHYSLDAFAAIAAVTEIVVVVPADAFAEGQGLVAAWRPRPGAQAWPAGGSGEPRPRIRTLAGGRRRQDSVLAGLEALPAGIEAALVHDAARPLLRAGDIEKLLEAVRAHGAAALGTPVSDSIKRSRDGWIAEEVSRDDLWTVQTPQGARLPLLLEAYRRAPERDWTDEASALRHLGAAVVLVEGSRENVKITQPGDEALAEAILRARGR